MCRYVSICDLRPTLTLPIHQVLQPPPKGNPFKHSLAFSDQTPHLLREGRTRPNKGKKARESIQAHAIDRTTPELPGSRTGLPLDKSLKPKHSNVLVAGRIPVSSVAARSEAFSKRARGKARGIHLSTCKPGFLPLVWDIHVRHECFHALPG